MSKDILDELSNAYSFLRDPWIGKGIDEIARLRRLLEARWQPIASAPKDQWILAYQSNGTHGGYTFTGGHQYVCRWAHDDRFWYDKSSNILEIEDLKDKVVTYHTCAPTHWMPLPEPPNA